MTRRDSRFRKLKTNFFIISFSLFRFYTSFYFCNQFLIFIKKEKESEKRKSPRYAIKEFINTLTNSDIKTRLKEEVENAKNFPDELQVDVNRFLSSASLFLQKFNPSGSPSSNGNQSGLHKSDSQSNLITLQNSVFSEVSSAKELIVDDEISDKTRLPANVILPVWLASHCIQFFNAALLAYKDIHEFCIEDKCSQMNAGPSFLFYWQERNEDNKFKVSANQYFQLLTHYIHKLVQDPNIFPTPGKPFPDNFDEIARQIFKKLFPVFAHIHKCHNENVKARHHEIRFINIFKHYYLFARRFHLLDAGDVVSMNDILETLKPFYRLHGNRSNSETTYSQLDTKQKAVIEDIFDFVEIPRDSLDKERIDAKKNPPLPPKPEGMRAKALDEPKPVSLISSMPEIEVTDRIDDRDVLRKSAPDEKDPLQHLLEDLKLTKYLHVFRTEEIDYDALSMLNGKQLQEMGIPMGPRTKILKHFQNRKIQENKDSNIYLYDIHIHEKLGEGHFGEVFAGLWQGTTRVALKTLHDDQVEEFMQEFSILSKLKHPNIVSTLGLYEDPQSSQQFIVAELYPLGNLRNVLISEQANLTMGDLIRIAKGVAAGCAYLAEAKVVHRDLAARNVLVTTHESGYDVRVSDFGLSRSIQKSYYMATNSKTKFPFKWTSIEAIKYGKYSEKSDVWSYGILLYEVFEFGMEPYLGLTNEETITRVNNGYRLPRPQSCPQCIYDEVMAPCWFEDPNARPTFKQIFEKLTKIEDLLFGQSFKEALHWNSKPDVHTYKDDEMLSSTVLEGTSNSNHYKQTETYEMHYKDDKDIEVIKIYSGEKTIL